MPRGRKATRSPPGLPALTTGWRMTPGWGSTAPTRRAVSFTSPSSASPNDLVQRSRTCRDPATARAGEGRVQRVSEIGASRYGEVGDPAATRDRSSVTSLALPASSRHATDGAGPSRLAESLALTR